MNKDRYGWIKIDGQYVECRYIYRCRYIYNVDIFIDVDICIYRFRYIY